MSHLDYPIYEYSEVSAREVILILRRRRWTVLTILSLFLVLAAIITPRMTPVFQASATMLVEQSPMRGGQPEEPGMLGPLMRPAEPHSLDTQVEVLQSGPLRAKVMRRLATLPPNAYPSLTAAQVRETDILRVVGESTDPRIARDAANLLVEEYIKQTADISGFTIRKTRRFVEDRLADAQSKLLTADARLRYFQERNNLTNLVSNRENATTTASAIQEERRRSENELAKLISQIREVRVQIAREPQLVEGSHTISPNPKVENLQSEIRRLQLQRITLLRTLQPIMPEVREVDQQIRRLQDELAKLPQDVRNGVTYLPNPARAALQSQLESLQVQRRGLEPQVERLREQHSQVQARLAQFPALEARLLELQRERDQLEEHQKALSNERRNLLIREEAQVVSARPLTEARLPVVPIRPQPRLNFLVAAALGLVLGIGAACLREMVDDRLYTAEEAERIVGLPVLGRVPSLPRQAPRLITSDDVTPVKDSFRRLRASITFAAASDRVRTLMITSPTAGDGKSTTAANLGVAFALQGRRVILVDADLRDPSLEALFGIDHQPGLTEVLAGETPVAGVLRPTCVPDLLLLPAGTPHPNAVELLSGPQMDGLVQQLTGMADLVIFDTPPCLPVADAEVIGAQVDAALLVVGLGQARGDAVRMARSVLEQANVRLLGTVMNRMKSGDLSYYYRHDRSRIGGRQSPVISQTAVASHAPETEL